MKWLEGTRIAKSDGDKRQKRTYHSQKIDVPHEPPILRQSKGSPVIPNSRCVDGCLRQVKQLMRRYTNRKKWRRPTKTHKDLPWPQKIKLRHESPTLHQYKGRTIILIWLWVDGCHSQIKELIRKYTKVENGWNRPTRHLKLTAKKRIVFSTKI